MPYRRQRSPYWWISYTTADGQQVRRSADTAEFAEAKALEMRLRAESHQAKKRAGRKPRSGDFDTVLSEYLTPRLTPRTRSTARHLATSFAGKHLVELTRADIRAYVARRSAASAAPATINKELAMLSAAINTYNANHDASLPNPVSGQKQREPEGKVRWLTQAEYQRLLAVSTGHIRDYIQLACNTGLRRGEALTLTWPHIDFGRKLITLDPENTKSGRRRSIPLNQEADAALRTRAATCAGSIYVFCNTDGGHITDIKKGFAGACIRAGLRDVTPHTCRHTFASWLVIAGVPLYEVRDLLGHSTIKLTERYSHLAPENLRAAVDRIAV